MVSASLAVKLAEAVDFRIRQGAGKILPSEAIQAVADLTLINKTDIQNAWEDLMLLQARVSRLKAVITTAAS